MLAGDSGGAATLSDEVWALFEDYQQDPPAALGLGGGPLASHHAAWLEQQDPPADTGGESPKGPGTGDGGGSPPNRRVLPGVPAYLWRHGCGPTAAGMVVAYWDLHGFPLLVPEHSELQTATVNESVASLEHYNDYSLPMDSGTPGILPDKSELGGAHWPNNSIADWMYTSWSLQGNRYGWSWGSHVPTAIDSFSQQRGYEDFQAHNEGWGAFTWSDFLTEIDQGRPMVFLVDTDGNNATDHFITAIGYDRAAVQYAFYNTWDGSVHWAAFAGMSSGQPWGIAVATFVNPPATAGLPLFSTFDQASANQPPPTGGPNQPSDLVTPPTGSITVIESAHGLASQPVVIALGSNPEWGSVNYDFPPASAGVLRVEATVSFGNLTEGYFLQTVGGNDSRVVTRLGMTADGHITDYQTTNLGTYQADSPFRVRVDIDWSTKTWSAAVDNELDGFTDDTVYAGLEFLNPAAEITDVRSVAASFSIYGGSHVTSLAYDDVQAELVELGDVTPPTVTLSNGTFAEDVPADSLVGIFSMSGPGAGGTFTYTLLDPAQYPDNALFAIPAGTDELRTAAVFDYEARTAYTICVRSTDQGGSSTEQEFTVTVTDVPELPQVAVWDGRADGGGASADANWRTASNWVGDAAPRPGDELVFPAGVSVLNTANDFPAGTLFGQILVQADGYTLGGSSIRLRGGIGTSGNNTTVALSLALESAATMLSSAELALNGPLDLHGHPVTFEGSGTTTVNGLLWGDGGLTKAGTGTLRLAGTASNTFGGAVAVTAGILQLQQAEGIPVANPVTVTDGGTLDLNGQRPGLTNVTVSGHGARADLGVLANTSSTSGAYDAIRNLTLAGDAWIGCNNGGPGRENGRLGFGYGSGTWISLNGHTLTKIGSNEVIWRVQTTRTGAGGQLVIDGGAVASEFLSNNLPATVVVHTGGTLSALRANQNANVTLHTGATLASYDAWDAGLTTTWTGTITLAGDATLSAGTLFGYYGQPAHMTITGPLVGSGGLTKTGSATLTLGGSNSYQGSTVIQAGRVKLDVAAPVQWIADNLTGSAVSVWSDAVSGRQAFNSTTDQQPALSVGAVNGHNAVTFDGTDDNLYVPDSSSPLSNAGDFSLAVVFRPAASAGSGGNAGGPWYWYTGLVDAEQAGVTDEWGLVWSADNQVGAGLGNPDVTLWSGRTAALNTPHVAVYTRAGGTIGLYLDGQAVVTGGGGAALRNQTPFWIGSGSFPSRYFRGDIAEVRVFNQALSAPEANALTAALGATYGVAGLSLTGQDANRLPDTTAVTIATGATLDVNHLSERIGSLSGSSGSQLTLGEGTLTVGDALSTVFAGQITGSGGLTKTGTGSLTLSGDNTYAGGTAVQDGTLLVNNSTGSGTGTGPVTVQNPGSVLCGAGRIAGPVTVLAAATVAPGSPVTGTASLATGPLVLSGNTTLAVQLNGAGAGQWDQLAVAGAVELGGATLNVSLGGVPSDGDLFTLIANDGADPVSGTFAGLAEGAVLTVGGVNFQLSYRGGDGNDVVLRAAVTANLWITAAYLTDGAGNRMDVPPVGSYVWVQVEYRSRDLPAGSSYTLSHTFQGVTLSHTVDWGAGMVGDGFWWHRWGAWLVQPGAHDVEFMLDSGRTVVESSETDNAVSFTVTPMTFAPKFVTPLGGTPYQDWSIVNYVDLDLGSGVSDYRGGTYSYNGHDALDLTLASFTAMDRGVPVRAAAAGTVVAVHDGEFDRNASSEGQPANFVTIDHGQGWQTHYYHFRSDSIVVAVGDQVTAGQPLGLAGSSGASTDAHLHFAVYHNGHMVETYVAPDDYWASPLPYSGDLPGVLDAGTTDYFPPWNELKERPSETQVRDQSAGQTAVSWAVLHGIQPGHLFQFQWRRPDGSIYTERSWNDLEIHYGWWVWGVNLPSTPDAGTWKFSVRYDGNQLWEDTFEVTAAGAPEVRVDQDSTFVVDGRTTPLDFGIGQAGQNGLELTFTVTNHGSDPLTTSGLQVPAGFSVVEGLTATLAPGASDTFRVRLDTGSSGVRRGQIRFATNDADEAEFNFAVRGRVFGPPQITAIADDTGWSSADGVTRDATLLVSGTSDANNRIDVYRAGTWLGNTTADGSGRWSYDARGTSLAEGSHAFTATATNDGGSTSIPSAAYWVTIDRASPTASGLSPADGATGVAVDSYLVMTFNETIRPGAGSILLKQASDHSTVAAVDVAGGSVTVAGATATIAPGVTLTPLVEYYVEVPAGAFLDAAGNAVAGISGPATWNFVTETFRVTGLVPTASGFGAILNGLLDAAALNLYDGAGGALGTADVVVLNDAGQGVAGALIVDGNRRGVTWVATGARLPPGTYAVTLKSGSLAFQDTAGNLLDGDANNTSGGDFSSPLTILASADRMVSLPDIARGAGQPLNVPAAASGWPIRIDNAVSVTSLGLDAAYDPALLKITGTSLAAGVPNDWTVTLDTGTTGVAKIRASGTTPLSGTDVEVVRLTAAVPSDAPYGASQAIRLENVSLNRGAIAAVGDVAVHKAVYLGDGDGSGIHSSADAFLTVQAALGLASGFAAHAWTDPRIEGDADGSGVLSAADAFLIVQEGLGLSEPFVPDNPHIGITPVGGGVDPQFQIDVDVPASVGSLVTVPVKLAIEPAATNVGGLDFELFFDPSRLTIQLPEGVSAGADTAGWGVSATLVANGQLRVGMVSSNGRPLAVGLREIARLQFRVAASFQDAVPLAERAACGDVPPVSERPGYVVALDIEPVDARAGGYTWTDTDGSVLIRPAPRTSADATREGVWRDMDAKADILESVLGDLVHDLAAAWR